MSIGGSDSRIYGKMQYGGMIQKWNRQDWFSILAPMQQLGFHWDADTGKMKRVGPMVLNADTPWVHVKQAPSKRCAIDHTILWQIYGIIPHRCLNCWKVVVTPKNFKELLELEKIEHELGHASKCGIEMRDYTPKHYGGYFYTDSIDEGRERHEEVKKACKGRLCKKTCDDIILKRGCTEYEMVNGPSPLWHLTDEQEDFIRDFECYVDLNTRLHHQSDLFKNHVRLKWTLWAHANGDMSYQEFNSGQSLFPGYVRYHEGDILQIKHELAVANSVGRNESDPEVSKKFISNAVDFAQENDIPINDLGAMLGYNEQNPLKWGKILKRVPDELKGEQDETT